MHCFSSLWSLAVLRNGEMIITKTLSRPSKSLKSPWRSESLRSQGRKLPQSRSFLAREKSLAKLLSYTKPISRNKTLKMRISPGRAGWGKAELKHNEITFLKRTWISSLNFSSQESQVKCFSGWGLHPNAHWRTPVSHCSGASFLWWVSAFAAKFSLFLFPDYTPQFQLLQVEVRANTLTSSFKRKGAD